MPCLQTSSSILRTIGGKLLTDANTLNCYKTVSAPVEQVLTVFLFNTISRLQVNFIGSSAGSSRPFDRLRAGI